MQALREAYAPIDNIHPQVRQCGMNMLLVGIWLLLYGLLTTFSNSVPKYIIPVLALIFGIVIVFGTFWHRPSK